MWRRAQQPAGRTRRVARLEADIAESRHLRALVADPDWVAVRVETKRRRTLAGLWFFLTLGLVFTTEGVHRFLAGNATPSDAVWWAAWGVEPMFAGLLLVLLNFEAEILAHGINPNSVWLTRLKYGLLGSTMFMNVVPQLAPLVDGPGSFNLGSAVVHGIIPAIVFALAEVIPVIQARARHTIHQAYTVAVPDPAPETPHQPTPSAPTPDVADQPERENAPEPETPVQAVTRGPKLPAHMAAAIDNARHQARTEGREFTASDVRTVVKLPHAMAEHIATQHTNTNGHTVH